MLTSEKLTRTFYGKISTQDNKHRGHIHSKYVYSVYFPYFDFSAKRKKEKEEEEKLLIKNKQTNNNNNNNKKHHDKMLTAF